MIDSWHIYVRMAMVCYTYMLRENSRHENYAWRWSQFKEFTFLRSLWKHNENDPANAISLAWILKRKTVRVLQRCWLPSADSLPVALAHHKRYGGFGISL